MALCKISLGIVLKNCRLLSVIAPTVRISWFKKFEESPVFPTFQDTSKLNNEQWTNIRNEILAFEPKVQMLALDVLIIQLCGHTKNLELAKSYMEYLRKNKYDMNIGLIVKYFMLLYTCRNVLTNLDKQKISDMYNNLILKYPLLDASTAESCILALSVTERWRETVELLDMVKLSCSGSSECYSAIVIAAFNNGDTEMGWKYLHEMVDFKKTPKPNVYIAYVNYCSKNFKKSDTCVQEIAKLFTFLGDYDLLPDENVMEHIKKTFEKFKWNAKFTKITNLGVCEKCDHQLTPLKLTKEDFSQLAEKVLDKVLVGNDIYHNSTPAEMTKFINFVNKTKPYHVVVDGLNVAYKNNKSGAFGRARALSSVVRYFLDKNQVVFVLGRKHMLQWDSRCMNYIKNNSFLFLTDNLSSDDPCILYATLASGPDTTFISGDLMRQHKFILQDSSSRRMFKRWQMSHQYFISTGKENMKVTPPLNYLPAAQGGENCWHIPYTFSEAPLTESYEPPKNWLCLVCKKSRKSKTML